MAARQRKGLPRTKACARCTKRKKLDLFGDNPRMKFGKKSYCKPCSADLQRKWNVEHGFVKNPRTSEA